MNPIFALLRSGVCAAVLGSLSPAWAAMVTTTIAGHVATVSGSFQGKGVEVGDPFEMLFTFDDSLGVSEVVSNGGNRYAVVTDTFMSSMAGWSGTLPAFIASRYGQPPYWTEQMQKASWFRPIGTLHHEEWGGWGLLMITNYKASSGESYGWYEYGSGDNVAFLIDKVAVTPVPEPSTYVLMAAGLGLVGRFIRRRRQ